MRMYVTAGHRYLVTEIRAKVASRANNREVETVFRANVSVPTASAIG